MANYRAIATGNWSSGATWGGGVVPPNGEGHNIYSNNFTVTIDTNINVALITNAAFAGTFVGGGTAAVGGSFTLSNSVTLTAVTITPAAASLVVLAGTNSATIIATTINAGSASGMHGVQTSSSGTLSVIASTINGGTGGGQQPSGIDISGAGRLQVSASNITGGSATGTGNGAIRAVTSSASILDITGTITGGAVGSPGVYSIATTIINGSVIASSFSPAVRIDSTANLTVIGTIQAANNVNAITGTGASTLRFSGSVIYSIDGTPPATQKMIMFTTPLNARTRYALSGTGTYVDMFTADNSTALNQAAPTDVRAGVVYGISNSQTGRLTVPARGSVALSVNYGPSMPFTATVSGTTATATLAYSYPLVVGDQITVTGASNTEWNSTYTIASVVSGTSVTFTVPNTHSATAGTGANMQTTGTAVLDPAAVASAVWGAASRTITGGLVDTATTLTNAPTVPTPAEIRAEMDSSSTKLANLDATVSSRLAPSGTLATVTTLTNAPSVPSAAAIASQVRTELSVELARVDAAITTRATPANIPAADIAAIKGKTDLLNTTRLAQVSTTEILGNLLAQANS